MIQWSRVSQLREEVGEDGFDEVVALFFEEVQEVIDRLRSAPDTASMGEDMHFLKGSALNLGFEAFAGLCQRGEQLSADGQARAVSLSEILAVFDASKARFLNGLPIRLAS